MSNRKRWPFVRAHLQFEEKYGLDNRIMKIEQSSIPRRGCSWIYAIKVVSKPGFKDELKESLPRLYNGFNIVVEESDE